MLARASDAVGGFEVVHVEPGVDRKLLTTDDRLGLVLGPRVVLKRVLVPDRGPEDRPPRLGRDVDPEPREARFPALGHVAEVEEEGVEARAAGHVEVARDEVVVRDIVLAGVVVQDLDDTEGRLNRDE